jgi:pimeloyl-ACP methyl ester carboxylesterase
MNKTARLETYIEDAQRNKLAWREDDFTDPWSDAETVVMIHGLAESGEAFRAWVPYLSRDFRVIRLDLRGYGDSSPMPENYQWAFNTIIADILAVLDHLKISQANIVGGKIGGTIGLALAAQYPERVKRLVAIGSPVSLVPLKKNTVVWRQRIAEVGVEAWVRETQQNRMGTAMAPLQLEWWTQLMSKTAASTLQGFLQMVPTVDVSDMLEKIQSRSLIVVSSGSSLNSVEEVRSWQQRIPDSRLLVIDGESYHVGATHSDVVAKAVQEFLLT